MGEKSRPTYTFPAVIVVLHSSLLTRAAALYRSLTPCALSFSPSHLHHVLPYVGGELVEVSAGEAEDAQSHRDKTKRQHRHLERSAHPRPERRERDSTQHAPCKVDKTYGCVKKKIPSHSNSSLSRGGPGGRIAGPLLSVRVRIACGRTRSVLLHTNYIYNTRQHFTIWEVIYTSSIYIRLDYMPPGLFLDSLGYMSQVEEDAVPRSTHYNNEPTTGRRRRGHKKMASVQPYHLW